MKKTFSINSTPDLIGRVDHMAKLNKRSRSAEVEVAIENHLMPHQERVFTETQISQLQSKVHKITGDGKVMGLFNELLGVCVGG